MGKQSARLYYQGNDHKDVVFREKGHDKMYKGSSLLWEKIFPDGDYFLSNVNYGGHSSYDFVRVYPKTKEVCTESTPRPDNYIYKCGFENASQKYFFTAGGMISKNGKTFYKGGMWNTILATERQDKYWIGDDFIIPSAMSSSGPYGQMAKIIENKDGTITVENYAIDSDFDFSETRNVYGYGTNYIFIDIGTGSVSESVYYQKVGRIDKNGHCEELHIRLPGYKTSIYYIVNCGTILYIYTLSLGAPDSKETIFTWYKSDESLSTFMEISREYVMPIGNPIKVGEKSIYYTNTDYMYGLMIFSAAGIAYKAVGTINVNIVNRDNETLVIKRELENLSYHISLFELVSSYYFSNDYNRRSSCAAYVKNGKIDNSNPPGIVFDVAKEYTKEDGKKTHIRFVVYLDNFYFEESDGNFAYIVEETEEE